ncbi:MAG: PIN domain-containing protein [Bifidobacteriaceae bacterium]|nr:PIN domain-containing protein [Bifidobacteriaceae bacterium]
MIVLDSEGLSRLIRRDPDVMALAKELEAAGESVTTSAATLVEGIDPAMKPAAIRWAVSGLDVIDVSRAVALTATDLLRSARRHGHRDAMDAIVCATAILSDDAPVTILTSDPNDIKALLADHPEISVLAT